MKKLASTIVVLITGFLYTNAFGQVQTPKELVLAKDSTVKLTQGTVVPASQTYNVYDENGKLLGTYTEGTSVIVPASKGKKKMDCAIIRCPKSFKKGVTCWQCK